MSKLQDLKNFMRSSENLKLTLPDGIVHQMNEMEELIDKIA